MVIVFQNLFGHGYEGGANWLETALLGLGTLETPPTCIIWDGKTESLPESLKNAPHVETITAPSSSDSTVKRITRRVTRPVLRRPWENPALTQLATDRKVDLWIGFTGFEGLGPQRPLLVWFPDFQFRQFPELFEQQELLDRERQWNYVASRADGIIAISQAVADDALASHPEVANKIHVCGFPPIFSLSKLARNPREVREQYHLPESFFLVCNQFFQHKNHAVVIDALDLLKQQGQTPPVIAFTGMPHDYRRPDSFSKLLRSVNERGLHDYCRFLGVIPRDEQIALIRVAAAVVQPSKFEGRGAIVEEASVLGTQLLCSDLPVHRELNAPGALFFPTDGANELAQLLKRDYSRSTKNNQTIAEECQNLAKAYGEELIGICERVLKTRPHT